VQQLQRLPQGFRYAGDELQIGYAALVQTGDLPPFKLLLSFLQKLDLDLQVFAVCDKLRCLGFVIARLN
jgi:hypothetical protein